MNFVNKDGILITKGSYFEYELPDNEDKDKDLLIDIDDLDDFTSMFEYLEQNE